MPSLAVSWQKSPETATDTQGVQNVHISEYLAL